MEEKKVKKLFPENKKESTFGISCEKEVGLGLQLVREYLEKNK
ncbi:hypothetical protein R9C00_02945 [Flammeovirgaceae bacterium SG7u.111]|nr:hypothetical protein [Flammeovirgaceae bacterium SG7u.132]WPO36398.1 hypothetical protein R9C00_02945 [Flammeovirgaceae bacterium SG7u.111]